MIKLVLLYLSIGLTLGCLWRFTTRRQRSFHEAVYWTVAALAGCLIVLLATLVGECRRGLTPGARAEVALLFCLPVGGALSLLVRCRWFGSH